MNVILFGGSGFLGLRLKKFLLSKKYNVFSAGRSYKNEIVLDILDPKLNLDLRLHKYKFDIAVNLIAITNVLECEVNVDKCTQINVLGSKLIAEFCKKNAVYLLNISTDMIYDKEYSTEKEPNPQNSYSISKLKAEKYLEGFNSSSLRLAFLGKSLDENKGFVDWLLNSVKNKFEIKLWDNVYSTPLSIKDTLDAILIAIELRINGIYNVGSSAQFTKYQFGIKLLDVLGISYKNIKKVNYQNQKEKVFRPLKMSMNSSKFISLTNWRQPDFSTTINNVSIEYLNEDRIF